MTRLSTHIAVAAGGVLALVVLATSATAAEPLTLTPDHGAPGTSFTAVFTFNATECTIETVTFTWDQQSLGPPVTAARSHGSTCEATLATAVPDGASPGVHTVSATSSPTRATGSADFTVPEDSTSPTPGPPATFSLAAVPPASLPPTATPVPDTPGPSDLPPISADPSAQPPEPSATGTPAGPPAVAASGDGPPGLLIGVLVLLLLAAVPVAVWARRSGRLRPPGAP